MHGQDRSVRGADAQAPLSRAELDVRGLVQGVWFRQSTCTRARELGLAGHVENLPDGRVHVVAEGPRDAVDALIAYCHIGPPAAHVLGVDVRWTPPEGLLHPFEVLR